MKKTLLYLFLTFLSAGSLWSQCVYTCSNYAVSPITYTTFPSGSTNVTPTFTNSFVGQFADDGSTGPIPIGFSFDFYCNTYTNIHICSNGFIMFDYMAFPWPTQYVHPTQSLPDPALPNGMVAFNMTDLDPGAGGTITYTTVGTTPNQKFIVTYSNVPCFSTPTDLNTGQIILYETSNIIEIHTASAKPDINQATLGSTQGIENTTGTAATTPPGRNANNSWGASANNTAYRFSPFTPVPPAAITGNTILCEGGVGSYQATFINGVSAYNWTLPAGWVGTSTISAITATSGASGALSVTATYTCGTSGPTTVAVLVNPSPTVSISSATPGIICSGKTVTFSTAGAVSYTLNPGGLIGMPPFTDNPITTTVYTLTGTGSNGCVSVNNSTVTITVKDTPLISVNSGSICLGSSFSITPSGPPNTNYAVTGLFFNITPTLASQYSYSVVGTASNGCVSDPAISTLTVYALPVVGAAPSRSVMCVKESVVLTASGGNTYLWSNASSNTTISVSPTTNTFYVVTGTDSHGCQSSATVQVAVKPCTGIEEFSNSGLNVKVYPNPTNGLFEVRLEQVNDKTSIEVYNALGALVIKEKVQAEITPVDLKSFSSGLYYVKVKTVNQERVLKIVKE